jgi:hypothetical protein
MANTQGTAENPFCIDDIEPPRPPRPDKGNAKAKAYYELHDDKSLTDLPVDGKPTVNRAPNEGKSNRNSINAARDRQISYGRHANITTNSSSRTPAARHGVEDEVIIIDDDEPSFTPQTPSKQLQRETGSMPSETKAVIPSGSRAHAVPPAPSLSLSGLFSPRFGRPHVLLGAGEKEKLIPPTSRPVDPVVKNVNKTFPQGVSTTPVEIANKRTLAPPTGDPADPEREQATSRRVNTNATSIPTRVNVINEVKKTIHSPEVPERARKGVESSASKMPMKPRAIKTASSAPWRPSGNDRSIHQSARNHAYSPISVPVSKGNSYSAQVSKRRNVDERPDETSNTSSSHQKETPEHYRVVEATSLNGLVLDSVSALPDVNPTTTGAHASTSAAPLLPLLSSGTTPKNAFAIPIPSLGPLEVAWCRYYDYQAGYF